MPTAKLLNLAALALVAACGSSSPSKSSPLCEQLRPTFTQAEHERLDLDDRSKARPDGEKQQAIADAVNAILTVCTDDHWTEPAVKCIVAEPDASARKCGLPDGGYHRAHVAAEAVYTRAFGPAAPPQDPLAAHAKEMQDRHAGGSAAAGSAAPAAGGW